LISRLGKLRVRVVGALVALLILLSVLPSAVASNELTGRWSLTITIPDSPGSTTTRAFVVNLDVSPRGDSLHGRLNITDEAAKTVGGAWRQVGKNVSIAYELPCPGDGPCASLILLGHVKGGGTLIKKGTVIVMWDTANNKNPALFDTSNGSFRGTRIE
jgi:hypothetical protein